MPRKATQEDADGVTSLFKILGYPHVRGRAAGPYVRVETGPADAPKCGLRLRKISAEDWCVEMLNGARWKRTPNTGPRGNMVAAICDLFGQYERGEL